MTVKRPVKTPIIGANLKRNSSQTVIILESDKGLFARPQNSDIDLSKITTRHQQALKFQTGNYLTG